MDTRNFLGLEVDDPLRDARHRERARGGSAAGVTSNILADIVLNPGAIDFGTVMKGQAPTPGAHDRPDQRAGVAVREDGLGESGPRRPSSPRPGAIRRGASRYTLTVGIKPDAPAGPLRDEIRLLSNDRETPSIPVMVTAMGPRGPDGRALGARPRRGGLDRRQAGAVHRPRVAAVRHHRVEGAGDGFSVAPPEKARKTMHVLTLTYKPEEGTTRGDLRHRFRVHTDLPGEPPLDLTATLHVAP